MAVLPIKYLILIKAVSAKKNLLKLISLISSFGKTYSGRSKNIFMFLKSNNIVRILTPLIEKIDLPFCPGLREPIISKEQFFLKAMTNAERGKSRRSRDKRCTFPVKRLFFVWRDILAAPSLY